jgi:hypothetical protein
VIDNNRPRGAIGANAAQDSNQSKYTRPRSPWQSFTPTPDDFRRAGEDFEQREGSRRIWDWVEHQNRLDRSERRVRGHELDRLYAEVERLRLRIAGLEASRPIP